MVFIRLCLRGFNSFKTVLSFETLDFVNSAPLLRERGLDLANLVLVE